ncbi:vang-like protein 2 [Clavelina lepadiformis]|uniref:Vang-like protein n=1 Tax=Clavelina lepadiformis TaxID=159417 RepID=A0ABP0GT24_CLALP
MDTDKLDNDSEYSLATNRSERSRHSHRRHRSHERGNRRHRNRGSNNDVNETGGEKTVTIRTPPLDGREDRVHQGAISVNMPEDEFLETNTFISGTTDVTQLSHESLAKLTKDVEPSIGFHDCGYVAGIVLAFLAYVSPAAFLLLPKLLGLIENPFKGSCEATCQVTLIGMIFKLLILLAASWAIFFRRQRTSMPRVFMFRSLILVLVLLITLTYWLFYGILVISAKPGELDYKTSMEFADGLANCLLFVHYLSLVLLELRHLQTTYVLEVIRTTDGERKFYNIGDLSIQRCSVWVLEKYYCDFPVYNPATMRIPSRSSRMKQLNSQTFKVYDVDGQPGNDTQGKNRAIIAAVARRRDAGHNERYYEEAEYERRVRKRRARLVAATEDAFTHIRRAHEQEQRNPKNQNNLMDPKQAAEAIFPALARSLQKYLRTTRQHQHYDIDNIFEHLSSCIKHDMTPKAFLERYLHPGSYLTYSPRHDSSQWELISDEPLVNMLRDGTVFRLNQKSKTGDDNQYSLVVTTHRSPRIRLKEEFIDPTSHRFVLQMQSETSV